MNKKLRSLMYLKLTGIFIFGFFQTEVFSDQQENQLLLEAAIENNATKFAELLETGSDPNWIQPIKYSNWTLCEVTKSGKEELLRMSVGAGADINLKNSLANVSASGTVFCAISNRNIEALEILIENNVDLQFDGCLDCTRFSYGPVVGASALNEYQAVSMIMKKVMPSKSDIKSLIFNIEKRPILNSSNEYEWRDRVVQMLRESGNVVTPWDE